MTTLLASSARLPIGRIAAAVLALSLVPLALLTYFSLTLASDAVEREVESRLRSTASLSSTVVESELTGLGELVEAYAERPSLAAGLETGDRQQVFFHLNELRAARRGIYTTFVARPDGRLVEIVPATPSIVGKEFSFRDWYRGVTRTGSTYISEAYRTQATGTPIVVAAAAPVRRGGRLLGILVAAYSLDHFQEFTGRLARSQGVLVKVTDQRGTLIADGRRGASRLVSRAADPRVAAALDGRSGVTELDTRDGRRLSAYAPVPVLGWTVTTSVPSNTAFAAVGKLRSTVLTIAGLLMLLLLAGLALLVRTLRARREAEDSARRQAGINAAVLDSTTEGIGLVDLDGKLAVANGSFERLVSEIVGQPAELAARREPLADVAARIADRTTDPRAYLAALERIQSDPNYVSVDEYELADSGRAFERYSAPVRESNGTLIGRLLVLREVTAERAARRLKSELVATVSHELRTPLTGVLGFAELARRPDLDDETRNRYLDTIDGEARRLTTLIDDFLDIQRMEAGSFTLSIEPFDLRPLLREQVSFYHHQSSAHSVRFEAPADPLTVAGDPDRIAQVVSNLLSNAVKYSPAGGTIHVTAEQTDGRVRIAVRDEGLGIPADQQRQIFTKFFRVDSSDTRTIGGTGLGLALSREIVDAHGGRIGFDSAEGAGSTFWFELNASRTSERAGRHVLVIEDDAGAAALLEEWLTGSGYTVETASTGDDGLRRVLANPPAVVCLDMGLPGASDGWHVLSRLKASPETAHIPVVVCTGDNGRKRAAALGASDFLAKPFSAELLTETVERVFPAMRGSVLVVDDDPTVRSLVVETLGRHGLELVQAADGDDALREIEDRRPNAIVLDLMMPRVDGFAVLEHLQQDPELRTIPVIVLTARRLTAQERALLSHRAVSLLEKTSYSALELLRLVDRALGVRNAA